MKRLLLAFALLWLVGAVADFRASLEAYNRGDFATAMRQWRPLVMQSTSQHSPVLDVS